MALASDLPIGGGILSAASIMGALQQQRLSFSGSIEGEPCPCSGNIHKGVLHGDSLPPAVPGASRPRQMPVPRPRRRIGEIACGDRGLSCWQPTAAGCRP